MTSTRTARCTDCDDRRPSDPSLPFFEDRSPGTQDHRCRDCRKFRAAHEYDPRRVRPEASSKHECVPMTEGYPYDSFYCGCRGWD